MKRLLEYFVIELKKAAYKIAAISVFFTFIGSFCFWNDLRHLQFVIVISSFVVIMLILFSMISAWYKYLFGNDEYPFDNHVIGKTFSTLSSTSRAFRKGVNALHKSDFNTAIQIFGNLQEKENLKDSWKAVLEFFHGHTYHLMGYPTNAVKHYVKSIEHGINIDDIYVMAARCYTYTGCYDEAIEYYDYLIKKDTYIDYVLTDKGLTYLKWNKPEKALEMFSKAAKDGKNYSFALGGCSLSYLQMNDIDNSREYFARAIINNMADVEGFKKYYCSIAEANGLLDKIDDNMRVKINNEEDSEFN